MVEAERTGFTNRRTESPVDPPALYISERTRRDRHYDTSQVERSNTQNAANEPMP